MSRPRRAPVFSRLDRAAEDRKTDRLLEAADRWAKAMGGVTAELTQDVAENVACAFVREHPAYDVKHAVRTFQRAARIETARILRSRRAG